MREYIIAIDEKDVTMCFLNGMRNAELIRCKDCEGYDEGRCHWWYDDPEVSSDGYCYQAVRKEE